MKRVQLYKENNFVDDLTSRPSIFSAYKTILIQCITTLLWIPISFICVPLYLPGLFIWGRPPIIPSWSRFFRYLTAVCMEGKPEDNVVFTNRILVFLLIVDTVIKSPVNGVCWFIDELLYHSYHNTEIKDPIFYISGLRSGSTQMTEYLADDKDSFINLLCIEGLFPFIWVWRLVVPVIKMLGLDKHIEDQFLGKELKKRHNFNLFKSESLGVILGLRHMNFFSFVLGISFFKWGFSFSNLSDHPTDEEFPKCFVEFTDLVMKKLMYHRGSPKKRVLIKGHFMFAAKALAQRYQSAKFITMIRDPVERFHSSLNFLKLSSDDGPPYKVHGFFPITWRVVRDYIVETQICYCEEEMLFYNQSEESKNNKLALSFASYVNNLPGTLQHIYSFLNISLPVEVLSNATTLQGTTHNYTKKRSMYDPKYSRSLSSVGVDEEKLKNHLADYIKWMKELDKKNYSFP